MHRLNPKVDDYIKSATRWRNELATLRRIILGCPLTEEVKWRAPCYTFQGHNIVLIGGFKEYCAISFFKGALLKDAQGLLVKPGENTQVARLIRFTEVDEIVEMETILKTYLHEAIEVEKAGLKATLNSNIDLLLPEELQNKFDEVPALAPAFEALTPGRQRAYVLYFSAPKQSKTRVSRIEKYMPQIFDGKGLHDCTCGLSQKPPSCDGSHKHLR